MNRRIIVILIFIVLTFYVFGQNQTGTTKSDLVFFENYKEVPYYKTNGFGTKTEGGLSGKIIKVVNLNKDGPGSLKEAIMSKGPRLIVFEVAGVIDLERSNIIIREPYVTIAGQTAPYPGITIIKGGISVQTHDVVIQHIAVRPGDANMERGSGWEPDGISTYGSISSPVYNVVFDHVSATWAVDENLSVSGPRDLLVTDNPHVTSHDVTFYKCIIAEGLSYSTHSKGEHSKGTLLHDSVYNVSIIGCLYAHNMERNPLFKGGSKAVFVNNVIYNYGKSCIRMRKYGNDVDLIPSEASIVGNVVVKGINSETEIFVFSNEKAFAYLNDNIVVDRKGRKLIESQGVTVVQTPLNWPEGLVANKVNVSFYEVLRTAGSRPSERCMVDKRIINDLINGKGRIINSQQDVGGYPVYKKTTRKIDIPDDINERRKLLDELSQNLSIDKNLDISPMFNIILF